MLALWHRLPWPIHLAALLLAAAGAWLALVYATVLAFVAIGWSAMTVIRLFP